MSDVAEILMTVSMSVLRGRVARLVVDAARVSAGDRVVDVGCGPGTAARLAVRRGAVVTGVDPVPLSLRMARGMDAVGRVRGITWLEGRAESLPVPDGEATVVWAVSSIHHWNDVPAGLAEARRVLRPDGRLLLVDRILTRPGQTHGLTPHQIDGTVRSMTEAGFDDVRTDTRRAGRRVMTVLYGTKTA